MARKASSTPDSPSTAAIGFETELYALGIRHSAFVISASLPGQLFYRPQIPVCLWFLAKNKTADAKRGFRDRRQQTLFIDARKMGTLSDRVHRELTGADLENITSAYRRWHGAKGVGKSEAQTGQFNFSLN